MMEAIKEFKGEFRFLSNMYFFETPLVRVVDGKTLRFVSVEHILHYCKSSDPEWREFVLRTHSPYVVRKQSRDPVKCPMRKEYDGIKLAIVAAGVSYKYSEANPNIMAMLMSTVGRELIEGNWWEDDFWGYCFKTEKGENNLGKITMKRRDELENVQ